MEIENLRILMDEVMVEELLVDGLSFLGGSE